MTRQSEASPMEVGQVLAVIPARGGSKGLPMKNVRPFAGIPLIGHSILLGGMCPEIDRCIVTTDSTEIARVAESVGGEVPFLRPSELAQDDTSLWPVLQHALSAMESSDGSEYEMLILLDPTSPARLPSDISNSLRRLRETPNAVGIIAVSQPDFNPIWHCVVEQDGWLTDLFTEGINFDRRQDVPTVYRINGALYIWRSEFVRADHTNWRGSGKHLVYEIPEERAMSIDTVQEFEKSELLVTNGLITLPWLSNKGVTL